MAYQNVGTPRFYVDILQWYTAIGAGSATKSAIGLNPSSLVDIDIPETGDPATENPEFFYNFNSATNVIFNYWGVLGHKNATDDYYYNINDTVSEFFFSNELFEEIINVNGGSGQSFTFDHDGFSLTKFNNIQTQVLTELKIRVGTNIGCFTMGNIYDMPHSPDLKLKLSYEYDGVKTKQAKNGATLSNAMYTKPADWGDAGAWQLGGVPNHRTGRRIWDLQFSYLADSDIFPDNASTSFLTGDYQDDFDFNVLSDDDFFSAVWNKTLGNALPFIFQPDKNNSNPDQFAICKFVNNTLQYERVAHNTYNIKLKIEEVW